MMRMRASNVLARPTRLAEVLELDASGRQDGRGRSRDAGQLSGGAEKVADGPMGVLADFALMEVADPDSVMGRAVPGRHRRRTGVRM